MAPLESFVAGAIRSLTKRIRMLEAELDVMKKKDAALHFPRVPPGIFGLHPSPPPTFPCRNSSTSTSTPPPAATSRASTAFASSSFSSPPTTPEISFDFWLWPDIPEKYEHHSTISSTSSSKSPPATTSRSSTATSRQGHAFDANNDVIDKKYETCAPRSPAHLSMSLKTSSSKHIHDEEYKPALKKAKKKKKRVKKKKVNFDLMSDDAPDTDSDYERFESEYRALHGDAAFDEMLDGLQGDYALPI